MIESSDARSTGSVLDEGLRADGSRALLVLSESARDPHLAPFVGAARLAHALVVKVPGHAPRLGFLGPMERDEAARSGLPLLTPEALDVARWSREGASPEVLWAEVIERALHLCELAPGRIALAGHLSAGVLSGVLARLAAAGWSFAPGEPLLALACKPKGAAQVDAVRAAIVGVEAAMRAVARRLVDAPVDGDGRLRDGDPSADPLRVGTLRRLADRVLAEHGLEQPAGNLIAPAEQGAVPHSVGDDARALRAGETLIVDLFPRGQLFADSTRTFVVGTPPEVVRRAHGDVVAALERAESLARPGARGWELQQAVCELLAERGWPTPIHDPGTERGYVHGLGHGVGWEVHELPSFREHASDDQGALALGDVFTLEPGLYEPWVDAPAAEAAEGSEGLGWAVRVEDTYALVDDGGHPRLDRLTTLPRGLDPRALLLH
ncbi:MAG: M24 family metallopeptidase [Acidobacteriota bacterium]